MSSSRHSSARAAATASRTFFQPITSASVQHERVDPNEPDVFRPFDEGAIDAIVSQMSSITPRRIMKTMERITEMTRTANFNPAAGLIPSEFLEEHGITDEIAAIPL